MVFTEPARLYGSRMKRSRAYFIICQLCYWCASCIKPVPDFPRCPACGGRPVDMLPISDSEFFREQAGQNTCVVH